jgi:excisionase family DNA binding protein
MTDSGKAGPGYWTTREVAAYLRLHEKKIYQLVSEGRLPAARISGKWLFEKELVDRWVRERTVYPGAGVLAGLLDRVLVLQGSDDWLLDRALTAVRPALPQSLVSARVGSLAGLSLLEQGRAHLAGVHVEEPELRRAWAGEGPLSLLGLFRRQQGLMLAPGHEVGIRDLADVVSRGLRFALRQPGSGTHRLTERLLGEQGLSLEALQTVGPFVSHLESALAVRSGQAEAALGIRVAADQVGLPFVPLCEETFQLAVPARLFGEGPVAAMLERALDWLRGPGARAAAGYDLSPLGQLTLVPQPGG